jgi:hypothetical protein
MARLLTSSESGINCPTYEMEEGDEFETVMRNAIQAHGQPVGVIRPGRFAIPTHRIVRRTVRNDGFLLLSTKQYRCGIVCTRYFDRGNI